MPTRRQDVLVGHQLIELGGPILFHPWQTVVIFGWMQCKHPAVKDGGVFPLAATRAPVRVHRVGPGLACHTDACHALQCVHEIDVPLGVSADLSGMR